MNKKLVLNGFSFAVLVAAYVTLVAWGLKNGERWFGGPDVGIWGPVLFLMLFCLSAATVGALLFGRPIYLVLSGKKIEAFWQAACNIGWLFVLTLMGFVLYAAVLHFR